MIGVGVRDLQTFVLVCGTSLTLPPPGRLVTKALKPLMDLGDHVLGDLVPATKTVPDLVFVMATYAQKRSKYGLHYGSLLCTPGYRTESRELFEGGQKTVEESNEAFDQTGFS